MSAPKPARAKRQRSRAVPVSFLIEQCRTAESTVLHHKLATKEELDPWRPGGAENAAKDAYGWLVFYRHLYCINFARRSTTAGPTEDPMLTRRIEAAMLELPIVVELESVDESGTRRTATVRQLGFEALSVMDDIDRQLRELARKAAALDAENGSATEARERVHLEICYLHRLQCWILCSEAAPRLPFDPITTLQPKPDVWTETLNVFDVIRIMAGHHAIHGRSMTLLRTLMSPSSETSDGRVATWQTLFAGLESDSNGQIPARVFMRDRGLPALLASRVIAGEERKRAYDDAKREAEQSRER